MLFLREGMDALRMIKEEGCKVFLDLKFFDIPSVIKRALEEVAELVDFFTLHLLMGKEALLQIKDWALHLGLSPLGVTLLTSMGQESVSYTKLPFAQLLRELLLLAKDVGLFGVVCHPYFIKDARKILPEDCAIVTPAIRVDGGKNEHVGVLSPSEAARFGATHIVCGRPIINAEDPALVCKKIKDQIKSALFAKD